MCNYLCELCDMFLYCDTDFRKDCDISFKKDYEDDESEDAEDE